MIADTLARRYLLGDVSEGERASIEEEYFRSADSADHIGQVEEELIEDYLIGRLVGKDHERFERVYLASPAHRIRVETIRRLTRPSRPRAAASRGWLALAAAAMVAIALGGLWYFMRVRDVSTRETASVSGVKEAAPSTSTARAAPANPVRVYALSLTPINVRGSASPADVIPTDIETITLQLEGEHTTGSMQEPHVTIDTVEGRHVWKGAADQGGATGIIARASVPAADLPDGDYIVRLFAKDPSGVSERGRYFLRIRR